MSLVVRGGACPVSGGSKYSYDLLVPGLSTEAVNVAGLGLPYKVLGFGVTGLDGLLRFSVRL